MKNQQLAARFSILLLPVITILALILVPIFSIRATPTAPVFFTLGPGINWGTDINPGWVYDIAVTNSGKIYATGMFTQAGWASALNIAYWSDENWYAMKEGLNSDVMHIPAGGYTLAVNNNSEELYVGGRFSTAGNITDGVNGIARWSNGSWHTMGNGIIDIEHGQIYTIAIGPNGDVYAGGNFTQADGAPADYLVRWNSSEWLPFGDINGRVDTIAFDGIGNMYIGGAFTQTNGIAANHIAFWDGDQWSALEGGVNGRVTDLAFDKDGNLYASSCAFYPATEGQVNFWNGNNWHLTGNMNECVESLAISNLGTLYAAGGFTQVDGETYNYIARFVNNSWIPLGAGADNVVYSLTADSTGNIYIGGKFGSIDGINASGIVGLIDDDIGATQTAVAMQTEQAGATQTAFAATQTANAPTTTLTPTSTPGPIHLPLLQRNWPPVEIIEDAPNFCRDALAIKLVPHLYSDDFDASPDADWYRFEAEHGKTYTIKTSKVGSRAQTVLHLYEGNCPNEPLATGNDTENGGQAIEWSNTGASGWYQVLVYEASYIFGEDTNYTLSVTESP